MYFSAHGKTYIDLLGPGFRAFSSAELGRTFGSSCLARSSHLMLAPMEPHAHCTRPSYIRSTFEAEIGHSLNSGRLVPHRRQLSRRGAWRLTCGYGGAGQGRKRNGYLYLVGRVIHCVPNLEQQLLLLSLERASPLRPGMTCCPSIRVIPPSLLWAS